jgi:PIN domain nuclease of toxin-antitoxin system
MDLILDTHTFLYFIMGNAKLSSGARTLIEDKANKKLVSKASLWEMAIKVSLGKLAIAGNFSTTIPRQIQNNGFNVLNLEVEHIALVVNLPFHHKDPFDRILIAQSMAEGYPIVSADGRFDDYAIKRLW